eukprot:6201704-Pleurochrysis_carterae.AAC.2
MPRDGTLLLVCRLPLLVADAMILCRGDTKGPALCPPLFRPFCSSQLIRNASYDVPRAFSCSGGDIALQPLYIQAMSNCKRSDCRTVKVLNVVDVHCN